MEKIKLGKHWFPLCRLLDDSDSKNIINSLSFEDKKKLYLDGNIKMQIGKKNLVYLCQDQDGFFFNHHGIEKKVEV